MERPAKRSHQQIQAGQHNNAQAWQVSYVKFTAHLCAGVQEGQLPQLFLETVTIRARAAKLNFNFKAG